MAELRTVPKVGYKRCYSEWDFTQWIEEKNDSMGFGEKWWITFLSTEKKDEYSEWFHVTFVEERFPAT